MNAAPPELPAGVCMSRRAAGEATGIASSRAPRAIGRRVVTKCVVFVLVWVCISGSGSAAPLERSFWVHASLGLLTQRGYFGPDFPGTIPPTREQIQNAARMLTDSFAANRLYLVYHREMPVEDARRVYTWWREACPKSVELVPAIVLRMYDKAQTPVFAADELASLAHFFRDVVNAQHIAVFDIAPRRDLREPLAVLARNFPGGIVRIGLQPDEAVEPPFTGAVQDTWSGLCHGTDTERDWRQPGFGAETLRKWVLARNESPRPVSWNLVTVAWDYSATPRGGYPGYDDAEKNMPLPAGRNRAAMQLIRETARASRTAPLAGFSSDLCILQENSRSAPHDGRERSFYECLKRGEDYRGYYSVPFHEIVTLYRELRDRGE